MTRLQPFFISWLLMALCLMIGSTGCVVQPKRPVGSSRDHTFITYWPPPKSKQLKLAVKDNIDMKGGVTTAGSEYLARNSPPAARDAACLAIARQRGVNIVGKVNLSEFAVAPSGINDYFGTPKNPFNSWRKYIPGGSSCGSACAVATGKADIAFGTDTGGSVRVPAACCGVVGLKTTFGLVSLDGVFPIEPDHLDTVGPLARDVAGVAQGMDLLQQGFAARYAAAVKSRPSGNAIKIGRLVLRGTNPKIDQAIDDALDRAGFEVIILDDALRVKWEQAHKDGTTMAAAGTWISDRKFSAKLGVSARTKSIIVAGGVAYSTQYRAALARQAEWQRTLREVFKQVDFIALPTLQTLPPRLPPSVRLDLLNAQAEVSNLENIDAVDLARNPVQILSGIPAAGLRLLGIDLFEAKMLNLQNTIAVNFAGNPALALPVPLPRSHIPVTSLQLIGPPMSEAALLATGRLIEANPR
ncbi:MAG: amidase [Prosthecobacter sp.]|uniref:amidase n=1 Tax=Prosthecobacter sp. TaxID=1965333 RepID=UPI0039001EC7